MIPIKQPVYWKSTSFKGKSRCWPTPIDIQIFSERLDDSKSWVLKGHTPSKRKLIHPRKLTWNPKMGVWKMIFLFKQVIFRFHVSFQGCKWYLTFNKTCWCVIFSVTFQSDIRWTFQVQFWENVGPFRGDKIHLAAIYVKKERDMCHFWTL